MSRHRLVIVIALLLSACGAPRSPAGLEPAPPYGEEFHRTWMTGGAELSGYEVVVPRYGELRRGSAVAVVVSEPFSSAARVKAELPSRPESDRFPVLKLNLMTDFPTGVYDYNLMSSVFVALAPVNGRPAGHPTKVSFSSQEWCGQVYSQALFDADSLRHTSHSYFDGEGDRSEVIPYPREGLSEDVLLLWARGLAAPVLEPGETREVHLLRSLSDARLNHLPLGFRKAVLHRAERSERIRVPAGDFEAELLTVSVPGGTSSPTYPPERPPVEQPERTWRFYVERAAPRRVVLVTRSDGFRAELLGSRRLEYWRMNGRDFEDAVRDLGLNPRPPRTH